METQDQSQRIDRPKQESRICNYLQQIGIGRIYWDIDIKRIIPFDIIIDYVGRLQYNIENGKGLLLSGGVGVGKTSILSWIAQEAYKIGKWSGYRDERGFVPLNYNIKYSVLFCSVSRLFNLIFERRFDLVSEYQNADLLLFDDFGREYSSDFPISKFEDFIEDRYSNLKSTCITTNLTKEQLINHDKYARVIDRWRDKKLYQFIEIAGKSQRSDNKYNKVET